MLWSSSMLESLCSSSSLSSWCMLCRWWWWCLRALGGRERSRGCGLGDRSSSSVPERLVSLPFPPRMSLIMNFDRGCCRIDIDMAPPRCIWIGTVMPEISGSELIFAIVNGLSQPIKPTLVRISRLSFRQHSKSLSKQQQQFTAVGFLTIIKYYFFIIMKL